MVKSELASCMDGSKYGFTFSVSNTSMIVLKLTLKIQRLVCNQYKLLLSKYYYRIFLHHILKNYLIKVLIYSMCSILLTSQLVLRAGVSTSRRLALVFLTMASTACSNHHWAVQEWHVLVLFYTVQTSSVSCSLFE